jgi:hypothetical protein
VGDVAQGAVELRGALIEPCVDYRARTVAALRRITARAASSDLCSLDLGTQISPEASALVSAP